MARADLILGVVRAATERDDATMRRSVEAMIAEERAKHHHLLAQRLEDALRAGVPSSAAGYVAEPAEAAAVEIIRPERSLSSLVLPEDAALECGELIEEQERTELLRAHGLEPRHRLLLTGPPGNGKTTLAEALAEALYLPLVRMRYDAVIGSFLGETSSRLSQVFDFARGRRCVLFLDEFDAIAKERADEHETGEIKRVVSSLLTLIDALPSHVLLVAASNHPELLDRAAARRFEMRIALPLPTHAQRTRFFDGFLLDFQENIGYSARRLADVTDGASFSHLEDLVLDVRRRAVLNPGVDLRGLVAQRIRRMSEQLG